MLDEYMISLGFKDSQIRLIKQSYKMTGNNESNILYNLRNITNYFNEHGIDNNGVIKIITTIPSIVCTSVENIKSRIKELTQFGFNNSEIYNIIVNYSYILIVPIQKIKNKYKFFEDYNFKYYDVKSIILAYPEILNMDNYIIKKRFKFLEELGYGKKQIINIIGHIPSLIYIPINDIKNIINDICNLGFSKKETIVITSYLPEVFNNDNDINYKLNVFYKFGLSGKDIIDTIKKIPMILSDDYLNILEDKFNVMIKLGFSINNISNMIKKFPYILLLGCDLIDGNYKNLNKHDITMDMILSCPILIGYSSDVIKERIKYYKSINAFNIIKNNPEFLLYSLDLIKIRYNFISNKSEDIDLNNLFISDCLFKQKFNITRKELLEGGK